VKDGDFSLHFLNLEITITNYKSDRLLSNII